MKLIFINGPHGRTRAFEFRRWSATILSFCCLGIPLSLLGVGYYVGSQVDEPTISLSNLQNEVEEQSIELGLLQEEAKSKIRAITISLGTLQAKLTQIDALGIHITDLIGLDNSEFDFSKETALGGPQLDGSEIDDHFQIDLLARINSLGKKISDRTNQLETLEGIVRGNNLKEQAKISGWPIKKGWISSGFGHRTDPFTGKLAMHQGIDFAGSEGHQVHSLGAGIVTYSAYMQGYGQMVEIAHGDGFSTRYAHAQENLVEVGAIVEKGQSIALVGSTGRSTGAHVHLEVFKDGKPVDPSVYIKHTQP